MFKPLDFILRIANKIKINTGWKCQQKSLTRWRTTRIQCLPDTAGLMPILNHRDYDNAHTRLIQFKPDKPQHGEGERAQSSTPNENNCIQLVPAGFLQRHGIGFISHTPEEDSSSGLVRWHKEYSICVCVCVCCIHLYCYSFVFLSFRAFFVLFYLGRDCVCIWEKIHEIEG